MAPMAPGKSGNTKRFPASKRWCFTLNNATIKEVDELIIKLGSDGSNIYMFQEENINTIEKTPHLQGYVVFGKKCRPIESIGNKRIHWEKCKGSHAENIAYCSKESPNNGRSWSKGITVPKPIKTIQVLKDWQLKIEEIVMSEPDDRSIYWFWENKGNVGKSALVKYLCHKYNCLLVSGKGSDMKYLCKIYKDKYGDYPRTILFDIPRSSLEYISWTGLEEVKNGCFVSTKYECEMIVMNCPHIICFANEAPEKNVVSLDRWKITKIRDRRERDSHTLKSERVRAPPSPKKKLIIRFG